MPDGSGQTQMLKDRLKRARLRVTTVRVDVLRVLSTSGSALDAQSIVNLLRSETADRVTVYRTLSTLVEAGLAHRVDPGDRRFRFSITHEHDHKPHDAPHAHEEDGNHPHFVCDGCGLIQCIDDAEIVLQPKRSARAAPPKRFRITQQSVTLHGTCEECGPGPSRPSQAKPRRPAAKPGGRRAFTLIELLVVIAIIAVLISILLPALSGARTTAKRLKCSSDLRQFILAITTYTNDARGYFPLPNWGPVASQTGWLYGPEAGAPPDFTKPELVQTGSIWSYIAVEPAYRCPAHAAPYAGSAILTSFIMNGAIVAYGTANRSFKIDQMRSDALIMWDANEKGPVAFNDGASFPSEVQPFRHGNGVNLAAVDGASLWFSTQDFNAELKKEPGRLWCNPISRNGH